MRYVSCFTACRSRAAQAQPKCSEGEKKERRAEAMMNVRVDGDAVWTSQGWNFSPAASWSCDVHRVRMPQSFTLLSILPPRLLPPQSACSEKVEGSILQLPSTVQRRAPQAKWQLYTGRRCDCEFGLLFVPVIKCQLVLVVCWTSSQLNPSTRRWPGCSSGC